MQLLALCCCWLVGTSEEMLDSALFCEKSTLVSKYRKQADIYIMFSNDQLQLIKTFLILWPHCLLKEEDERTAGPIRGNLTSAQRPNQATWLVGRVAGWAFLCCCHNGIITPGTKAWLQKRGLWSV